MDAATLKKLFETSQYAIHATTAGLTHEESLVQPAPAGNCANWILGHIVATRNMILKLLRVDPIWSPEQAALYDRGAAPLTEPGRAADFTRILADYDASQERLMAALDQVTPEELAAQGGKSGETVGWLLSFLQFHETYHAGQLGLMRRLLGKDGAIA